MTDRALARVLWSFSRADTVAGTLSRVLSQNPCLTVAEQSAYGDRIAREEQAHSTVTGAWAEKLGGGALTAYAATVERDCVLLAHLRDPLLQAAWTLATVRWNEEQGVRGFARWRVALAGPRPALASDLGEIEAQERDHVATNLGVCRRLAEDPGFRRAEALAYRLTRAACGPALHRTVTPTLKILEVAQ